MVEAGEHTVITIVFVFRGFFDMVRVISSVEGKELTVYDIWMVERILTAYKISFRERFIEYGIISREEGPFVEDDPAFIAISQPSEGEENKVDGVCAYISGSWVLDTQQIRYGTVEDFHREQNECMDWLDFGPPNEESEESDG